MVVDSLESLGELVAPHLVLLGDLTQPTQIILIVNLLVSTEGLHKLDGLGLVPVVNQLQVHVYKHWVEHHA